MIKLHTYPTDILIDISIFFYPFSLLRLFRIKHFKLNPPALSIRPIYSPNIFFNAFRFSDGTRYTKRALFLRWSNLGAYIRDPLYVRCTGRGALNLARVRRNVLSGDRYYRRFGDGNEGVWEGAWITGMSFATRTALTCGARKRVGRARCIRFRPVHYFCGDALLLRKTQLSPSLSLLTPLHQIPSETTRVSFCARPIVRRFRIRRW